MRFTLKNQRFLQYIDYQNVRKTEFLGCQSQDRSSTCSILEHMANDGRQRYTTQYYNLDAILSVGYRVNSKNATLFRKWANQVLKEYCRRNLL